MQNQTVYVCTGGCGGVSAISKNCGAAECSKYNQPLETRMQCDACAAAASKDGKAHACGMCSKG